MRLLTDRKCIMLAKNRGKYGLTGHTVLIKDKIIKLIFVQFCRILIIPGIHYYDMSITFRIVEMVQRNLLESTQ